jgi:RNA polymerase sigma-70 factor (ECF subfamily)
VGETGNKDLLSLVQGCIQDDRESQGKLYKLFYGYAMSICTRYTKTREEAVEVLNDGFLKIFQKIGKYDSDKSFKGWVRKIMINTALDNYRQNLKHYYAQDVSELEQPAVLETADEKLHYADLIRLVQELSPGYRAVFNLYVIDGYTHEEIAQLLTIAVGTSKSNLSKARAYLQARLKKSITDEHRKFA